MSFQLDEHLNPLSEQIIKSQIDKYNTFLRLENATLRQQIDALNERLDALREKNSALREKNSALHKQTEDLEARLESFCDTYFDPKEEEDSEEEAEMDEDDDDDDDSDIDLEETREKDDKGIQYLINPSPRQILKRCETTYYDVNNNETGTVIKVTYK